MERRSRNCFAGRSASRRELQRCRRQIPSGWEPSTVTAELFFGREPEILEFVEQLRTDSLVMVVGDSGSGKSSLVKGRRRASVARRRAGSVGRNGPDDSVWQVVETRRERTVWHARRSCVARRPAAQAELCAILHGHTRIRAGALPWTPSRARPFASESPS